MAHDVFICYSSKDKTTADAVCAVLESEGIRCWIAPRDILAGASYGGAIVEAIHSAKALVLVFSGHANASPQIEREVERAINHRIPVIPLRIEDVAPDKALEYFLSTPHWLDAFTPPLERHLRNLAAQIHRLIVTGDKADEMAAKDTAAAISSTSPFKTVQTPEPSRPAEDVKPAAPMGAGLGAAAGAAAGATAGAAASTPASSESLMGSVPHTASGTPATSPVAWFKKLDTGAKVGIGAGAVALIIGIGWMLSSSGERPTPSVVIGPTGSVNVTDGKDSVHVGPDGVRIGETPIPPAPGAPDRPATPGGAQLPSDGDINPTTGMRADAPDVPVPPSVPTVSGEEYNAVSSDEVLGVLSAAGHEGQADRDSEGDPMVKATVDGFKYTIFFYRCNKGQTPVRCLDLQFHSSFTNDSNVTDEKLNAYNRDNRFGQAYFQQNGEIGLDMSATMQGGVTRSHIKEVVDWWKTTLTGFPRKVNG